MLVVWGLFQVARDLLVVLGLSIPLLAKIAVTLALIVFAFVGSDLLEDSIARFGEEADRVTEHLEEILLRIDQIGILALVVSGALIV